MPESNPLFEMVAMLEVADEHTIDIFVLADVALLTKALEKLQKLHPNDKMLTQAGRQLRDFTATMASSSKERHAKH